MAVLLALSCLSGFSGLTLILAVAATAAWVFYRRKDRRGLVILGVSVLVAWAALAGWWYVRNINLYGEPFGTGTMSQIAGLRPEGFAPGMVLNEFQDFRIAYWGIFGAANIQSVGIFYFAMDVLVLGALISLVFLVLQQWVIREYEVERTMMVQILLLGLIVLTGIVGVVVWSTQTPASQGRLMFPYMAAISTLLAVGIVELAWWLLYVLRPLDYAVTVPDVKALERRSVIPVMWGVWIFAFFALLVPIVSIAPHYTPPTPIASRPDTARRIDVRFGDVALVGYRIADARYRPGQNVPVTLYWEVLEQSERDYSLSITVLDDDGDPMGRVTSYPGAGRLRTSQWEPGEIYADTYDVPLTIDTWGRFPLSFAVNWWHIPTYTRIAPRDVDGRRVRSVTLDAGAYIGPEDILSREFFEQVDGVHFGNIISLAGYRLRGETLMLRWEVMGMPEDDYRVFVRLLDGDIEGLIGPIEMEVVPEPDVIPSSDSYDTPSEVAADETPETAIESTAEATAEVTPEATPGIQAASEVDVAGLLQSREEHEEPAEDIVFDFSDFDTAGEGDARPTLPTHYWRWGEIFITRHKLDLETLNAGTYLVVVGWDKGTYFTRLEIGEAYPDSAYPILVLEIDE